MKHERKTNWTFFIRLAGSLLSILILVIIFSDEQWSLVWQQLRSLQAWRIAACIVLMIVSRLATWGRWHSLLRVSSQKVSWKDTLRLTFTGLFAANVLPTTIGGDAARLAGALRLKIDGHLAAASLLADRLIGMTGMLLALPLGLPHFWSASQQARSGLLYGAVFGGLFAKLKESLGRIWENLRFWLQHPQVFLRALAFSLLHQLCLYLIVHILIHGFGETLPLHSIAGLWSLVYFITLVPISINGLGVQELSISNLFSSLGGLSLSTGLSIALFMRVLQVLGSLPGAFFVSGVLSGAADRKEQDAL